MNIPSEEGAAAHGARPDRLLLAAAIGSLLLALPGAAGVVGLAVLASGSTGTEALGLFVVALVPAVGFYLLVGYWWGMRRTVYMPQWFWWLSASYNGVGMGISAGQFVERDRGGFQLIGAFVSSGMLSATTFGVIVLTWTVLMTAFSVSRARRMRA